MKKGVGCGRYMFMIVAVIFLAAVCGIGALKLYAYLSDEGVLRNRFTIEENEIAIEEPDFSPPPSLTPGGVYPKTVQIRNVDGVDCYVRVCLVYSDDAAKTLLEADLNTTDWVYDEEGDFYYYREALKEGESTKPLLTRLTIGDDVTGEQLETLGAFSLDVVAESCQKGDADTYQEAWRRMTANKDKSADTVSKNTGTFREKPETEEGTEKTVVRERKLPVYMGKGDAQQSARLEQVASTKEYSVTNKSKMGIVAISLELVTENEGTGSNDGQFQTILPGQKVSLSPRISNEGADCYVRLRITDARTDASEVNPDVDEAQGDATEAPEDAAETPEDATEAPEDATETPEDATEAPEDATETPEDATETPENVSEMSEDVSETPEDVFALSDAYGLGEGWVQIGEYLYLTTPLAQGESTEAFAGMTVPQTLDSEDMGAFLSVEFLAEAVQADYFTPDFTSDSPWGDLQTESCIYSAYAFANEEKDEGGIIRLTYEGGAQQFVSASDDFFAQFGAMLPGGVYSGMVQIENRSSAEIALFFHAENADGAASMLDGLGFSLVQVAADGSEKVLYDGDYRAKALQEEISLGTFETGAGCSLRFTIRAPAEMTNADALAQAQIDWHFRAQQQALAEEAEEEVKEQVEGEIEEETNQEIVSSSEGEAPAGSYTWGGKTGDAAAVGRWLVIALLAGALLAVLGVQKRRHRTIRQRSEKNKSSRQVCGDTKQSARRANPLKALLSAVWAFLLAVLLLYGAVMTVPRLFGYSTGVVLSGSMEPSIHTGSLCYIRQVSPEQLAKGEIVVFRTGGSASGMEVMHRVVVNDREAQQLQTKGDNNEAGDAAPVSYGAVLGRVVRAVPILGTVSLWVQKYAVLLIAAVLLLPLASFAAGLLPVSMISKQTQQI